MAKQTQTVDEIFAEIERVEGLKLQAIDQILQQRAELDAQLQKLGYTETKAPKVPKAPSGKKRTRRTKAQILADEEAERAAKKE